MVFNHNDTWYSRGIQMTVTCSKVFPVKKKSIPRVCLLDRLTSTTFGLENRRQLTYCRYISGWRRLTTWWNAIAPCCLIKVTMGPVLLSLILPTKEGRTIYYLLAFAVGYSSNKETTASKGKHQFDEALNKWWIVALWVRCCITTWWNSIATCYPI